jgi:EKC/KEOPS complex subunit CGI121/TPRKB
MATFKLSTSFPADTVHVFLFTEVLNAIQIRERLLAGDPAYACAFLDASMVRDASLLLLLCQILAPLQVLAAVNRAMHDSHYGLMRTKNVHSEIVYALAGTQNVPDCVELITS